MKLLVVGGTRFLGRHVVDGALARGHRVTLLNRGQSNAGLFPDAEHLVADRDGDLGLLQGRWDAVIDTCAYRPRQVRHMAQALRGRVGRYLLVSTISVYARNTPGTTEDAPLARLPDPTVEQVTGETYGGLKALCEAALQEAMPGRALVARPGLIVGPHDPTGRFTWWVRRFAEGGDMLAPGDPAAPVQFIDGRDLAAWLLRQAEGATTGTFNLTGPLQPQTMGTCFDAMRRTLSPEATLTWAGEDFLLGHGVAPWTELPLWVPRAEAGLHAVNIARAIATGLQCRPLADTLRDTLAWARAEPREHAGIGLAPERERELLAAWRAR